MALKSLISTRKSIRWFVLFGIIALFFFGVFERTELIGIDLRYHLKDPPANPNILLVLIDQTSLKQYPQWPWPRHYYAEVITTLKEGGAKIVGLDLDFSSRSQDSEDQSLVNAVSSAGNVVLGAFHEDRVIQGGIRIQSASLPFPELLSAAAGVGSILFPVDTDGTIRRAYWEDEIQGRRILGLPGELARQYLNLSKGDNTIFDAQPIMLGGHKIRTHSDGTFYISYLRNLSSHHSVSFADVLKGKINPTLFQDKIVLIGASSMELRDIWKSPFGLIPGVAIQANTVQTLLSGSAIYRAPPWITLLIMLIAFSVLEVSVTGSFTHRGSNVLRRFLVFSGLTLGLAIIYSLIAIELFKRGMILVDVVPVLTTILVHYLLSSFAYNLFSSQSVEVKTLSLSTLHSVGDLSIKKKPIDHSLDLISVMLRELLDIKYLMVELYHPSRREFIGRFSKGIELEENGDGLSPPVKEWIEKVMASKESVVVPDLEKVTRNSPSPNFRIRSSLFVPLITHNGQQGVLHIHSPKPKAFDEEDMKFLYTLCHQLALNIENLELVKETKRLFYSSISAFSSALELRDNETEGHSQRVAAYAIIVGRELKLDPARLEILRQGALLHDIGKIGVPDAILKKPGKLSPEEMQVIRRHSEYGYRMLKNIDFPEEVARILLHHHEQYDGSGYPTGLIGESISIYSRIFMVVDTYDAMRSNRPYRRGVPHQAVVQEIKLCSGTQFDPRVVEAFIKIDGEQYDEIRSEVDENIKSRGFNTIFSS